MKAIVLTVIFHIIDVLLGSVSIWGLLVLPKIVLNLNYEVMSIFDGYLYYILLYVCVTYIFFIKINVGNKK